MTLTLDLPAQLEKQLTTAAQEGWTSPAQRTRRANWTATRRAGMRSAVAESRRDRKTLPADLMPLRSFPC